MTPREQLAELIRNGQCAYPQITLDDIPYLTDAQVQRALTPPKTPPKITREIVEAFNRIQSMGQILCANDEYNKAHGLPTQEQYEFLKRVKKWSGKRNISMLDVNKYNKQH
jgi:hypothetical protein